MTRLSVLGFVAGVVLFGGVVACGGGGSKDSSSNGGSEATSTSVSATSTTAPASTSTTAPPAPAVAANTSVPPAAAPTNTSVPAPTSTTAPPAGASFNVSVVDFGFNFNPVFAVKAGQSVTLNVTNTGSFSHSFTITDVVDSGVLSPSQSKTVTFTAPASGSLAYFCRIHGVGSGTMKSSIAITP